jgi:hypothetical protein
MLHLFYFLLLFKLGCSVGDTTPKHFDNPEIPIVLEKIQSQSIIVEKRSFDLESYFDEYRRLSEDKKLKTGKEELDKRFQALKIEEEKLSSHMSNFRALLHANSQPQK